MLLNVIESFRQRPPFELIVEPLTAFAIVSAIQLALRHPMMAEGPYEGILMRAATTLTQAVADGTPEAGVLLERGWNPNYDI